MRLLVTTSLPPNILSHIYTCAGLTTNTEYRERFRQTLREEDHEFLKHFESHFRHRPPVAGGPLFLFLYQIPSYFPAENLEEMFKTFDILMRTLGTRSTTFQGIKPETVKALEEWMPPEMAEVPRSYLEPMLGELRGIIERLKDIVSNAYRSFYREHWKTTRPDLLKKAGEIQDALRELLIFEAWSEALRIDFPYKEFVVYLCEARLGATSLLAEKIALPSSITIERASETIIHEAGIHFIAPREYLRRGVAPEVFLRNQEELSRMEEASLCYLKPQVYSRLRLRLDSDYHIPLMKIEKEIQRFTEVWENENPDDVIDGILKACNLLQ